MKFRSLLTILIPFVIINFAYAQTQFLTIEPNHSTIGFEVPIAGGVTVITGKFVEFDMELTLNEGNWETAEAKFSIQAKSINTGIDDRDNDLKGESFFEVEKYPEITFVADKITKTAENKYIATGEFSMHGVTKNMDIPFTIVSVEGNTIGIRIETIINRIDFNVGNDWVHTAIPNFLAENVPIKIFFWTKKDKRKP